MLEAFLSILALLHTYLSVCGDVCTWMPGIYSPSITGGSALHTCNHISGHNEEWGSHTREKPLRAKITPSEQWRMLLDSAVVCLITLRLSAELRSVLISLHFNDIAFESRLRNVSFWVHGWAEPFRRAERTRKICCQVVSKVRPNYWSNQQFFHCINILWECNNCSSS